MSYGICSHACTFLPKLIDKVRQMLNVCEIPLDKAVGFQSQTRTLKTSSFIANTLRFAKRSLCSLKELSKKLTDTKGSFEKANPTPPTHASPLEPRYRNNAKNRTFKEEVEFLSVQLQAKSGHSLYLQEQLNFALDR